jgi:subtilase family serine protease
MIDMIAHHGIAGRGGRPALAILASVVILMLQAGSAAAQNVPLVENHPAEMAQWAPLGRAASYRRLNLKVFLALRNRAELDHLLAAQQDPASSEYHHWLTPGDFAARFGPQASDYKAVADWLVSEGFEVTSAGRLYVAFNGTVSQAERLFGVTIASTADDRFFGNPEDPAVPARFAGVIARIEGLDNLRRYVPLIQRHRRNRAPVNRELSPLEIVSWAGGSFTREPGFKPWAPNVAVDGYSPAFGPADIQTFYDETPLLNAGINGGNGRDCVAVVEDSNYARAAINLFDTTFSLPVAALTNSFPTSDPGINSDEGEALMDLEYAHAAAPNAPLKAYIGNNFDSIIDPIADGIQSAVSDDSCSAISVSFSSCGAPNSYFTATLDPIFSQAASQGQSVFISSGDNGAAGFVLNRHGDCVTGSSRNVNEIAADPNVTGVGGTEFTPDFDANGDDVGFVSEKVWNEGTDGGASGGGASAIFAKPAYQKGVTPSDTHRDVPDVALIASPDMPGVFMGDDASDQGSGCPPGQACINCCDGGTSLSAPLWAGISRLFAQIQGGRLGNLNPLLYHLGSAGKSAGVRDVTSGNNTFNKVSGYSAGPGYDQASGWGTLDIATLAKAFPTATPTPTSKPTPSGTLALSSRAVSFPATGTGTTATTSFSISNSGPGPLIGSINASGLGPAFSLAAGTATTFNLSANHSEKLVIRFAPTSAGADSGSLTITSNDAKHSPSTVTVSGRAVSGTLSAPAMLGFGVVSVNSKKTIVLTIKNTGLGELNGSLVTNALPAPFTASPGSNSFQLKDGQTFPVPIQFAPTSKGAFRGKISIDSNGGNQTVTVTGTGM